MAKSAEPLSPRKLKLPRYKSFRLQKRIKAPHDLPGSFRLFVGAFGVLRRNWKVFLGIMIVYGVLNALLVRGFQVAGDLGELKTTLDQAFSGSMAQLATGASLFVYMVGSAGSEMSAGAAAYQFMLVILISLALVWTLRQVHGSPDSKVKVRIRDAFYKGMTPLVPFLLVLFVIGLQLIPLLLGATLYSTAMGNGIAATVIEQVLWTVLCGFLVLLSLYMICSSVFALYIVSLPDMTPLRALRSARQLVRYRRWTVIRKIVFLPLFLLVLAAVVLIPLILFLTPVAPWIFFASSLIMLAIVHSYMYKLYRSLL